MNSAMNLEKTSLAQKIAWLLFCGTCLELVVLNAYAKVITGVKSDVYAGILCAFTLAVCLLVAYRRSVRGSALEICMSLALLAIAIVSGSRVPLSGVRRSTFRVGSDQSRRVLVRPPCTRHSIQAEDVRLAVRGRIGLDMCAGIVGVPFSQKC